MESSSHTAAPRARRARIISGEQPADVVTLGLPSDIEALRKRGLIRRTGPTGCRTIRRPTPRRSCSWCAGQSASRSRTGLTCLAGRRNRHAGPAALGQRQASALAAWAAVVTRGGTEAEARDYLRALYQHMPVLDEGARGAAINFADAGDRRRASDLGERGDPRGRRIQGQAGDRLSAGQHPRRAVGRLGRRRRRAQRRTGGGQGLSWFPVQRCGAGNDRAARLSADQAAMPRARPACRFPRSTSSPITAIARDWDDANEKFFAENGVIDDIIGSPRRNEPQDGL